MEEDQKEEIFQSPPEYQSRLSRSGNGSSAKRYLLVIVSVIIIVVIILGIFRFLAGSSETAVNLTPTPTQEVFPTEEPTPTEEVSVTPTEKVTPSATPKAGSSSVDKASGLDRSKLSVHVLNGSGIAGASKKMSDLLEGLGYNVIQIGNAENFDFAQTEIRVTTAGSKYLSLLKKDLAGSYTVASTDEDPPSDTKADAVVIVGKE